MTEPLTEADLAQIEAQQDKYKLSVLRLMSDGHNSLFIESTDDVKRLVAEVKRLRGLDSWADDMAKEVKRLRDKNDEWEATDTANADEREHLQFEVRQLRFEKHQREHSCFWVDCPKWPTGPHLHCPAECQFQGEGPARDGI